MKIQLVNKPYCTFYRNFLNSVHEQIQKLRGMERLWCVFGNRKPDGDCNVPHPAIFYVCFDFDNGFTHYSLYDPRFLEEYAQLYLGG